jgi:hypothetical protein
VWHAAAVRSRVPVAIRYGLVLVVALELACWESFLTASRPFGRPVPVAAVLAAVGNLAVGAAGGRVLGRPLGAALPGLLWLAVALLLGTGTAAGDVIVPESGRGVAFLLVGAAAAAAAVALAAGRPRTASPERLEPGASP